MLTLHCLTWKNECSSFCDQCHLAELQLCLSYVLNLLFFVILDKLATRNIRSVAHDLFHFLSASVCLKFIHLKAAAILFAYLF